MTSGFRFQFGAVILLCQIQSFIMKYVDFKVSIFALICLKYVADGQSGRITNGSGYFNISSSVFDLRLNITSMPAFNKTYSNCISTLKTLKQGSHEVNVICDECTKPCLPLSNTESSCSRWSAWSNCSGTCGNLTQTRVKVCTGPNGTVKDEFETIKCNVTAECQESSCSRWSAWSNCSGTCGNRTQTRVKVCTGPNGTVKDEFETIKCNVTAECQEKSTQTNRQEDVMDDAQNFTSAHIAMVAIACFLIGILVAALASIVYMKRKHQGCFFHNNKSVEVGSRMQSGPDLQSRTTRALANEYESMNNKNENKTVETSYDSLDLDKFSKDQQTYDHLEPEPPFEQCDNKPPSSHQKLTLRNGISANTTPSKIENVSEYERESQDHENVSRQFKPNSLETHTVVEDMVREVRVENGNTDHVYSVLEPADNTRKMLDRQSDADHNYFILETVDKVAEVGSG